MQHAYCLSNFRIDYSDKYNVVIITVRDVSAMNILRKLLPANGETSNKINVVTSNSIRKTHCTISHTILRQNSHDSYLLHRSPKSLEMPRYNNIVKIDASSSPVKKTQGRGKVQK